MSDTPETDASCGYALSSHYGRLEGSYLQMDLSGPFVHAEVARKLERERDEAIEKAERYRIEANAMMMQRDEARELHKKSLCEREAAERESDATLERTHQAERERDEAREALDRIARPVWWMQEDQKRKTGSINGISGGMALALSEDAEYLKGIAKSALKGKTK